MTTEVTGVGPLAGLQTTVSGYEIHMDRTVSLTDEPMSFGPSGLATERVLGTYLHGLFETNAVRTAFLETVREHADGVPPPVVANRSTSTPYEAAADLVAMLDLSALDIT